MEPITLSASDPNLGERLTALKAEHAVFVSPTDTVYGLSTRFQNLPGVERLAYLKSRGNSQFIILARNIEEVRKICLVSTIEEIIVKRYWPGPITFILNAIKPVGATIAVRIPDNELLEKLMNHLGGPILSTSCNKAGESPALTAAQARDFFGDDVNFYIDGGEASSHLTSTLVDLTGNQPQVVRTGEVSFP